MLARLPWSAMCASLGVEVIKAPRMGVGAGVTHRDTRLSRLARVALESLGSLRNQEKTSC